MHAWKHLDDAGMGPRRIAHVDGLVDAGTREGGRLLPVARNRLREEFVRSRGAAALRGKFAAFPPEDRVRLRYPRPVVDPERQGDLMVLKAPDDATGEKGVLLVMYHEAIEAFAACFDLRALAPRWQVVLETSNWGAQEWRFLPYLGDDLDVLVMAPRAEDFEFLAARRSNLVPLRVGSTDWVDPSVFTTKPADEPFLHDVIMVASWDALKRHDALLDALAALRRHGRRLSTLLVGVPGEWTKETIAEKVEARGLSDQVTILERIPHAEVARHLARSRCSVLLSRQEGGSRLLGESLWCGTPVVVAAGQRGVDLSLVNARTGAFATDDDLPDVLLRVVDSTSAFDPRGHAQETIGYLNATRKTNDALRALALRRGLPWTRDIAAKKNAPNQRYADPTAGAALTRCYDEIARALIAV
jgi:glycosyltransferase involved in cell wall biosynthesis